MLSQVKHEKSFITSGPDITLFLHKNIHFVSCCRYSFKHVDVCMCIFLINLQKTNEVLLMSSHNIFLCRNNLKMCPKLICKLQMSDGPMDMGNTIYICPFHHFLNGGGHKNIYLVTLIWSYNVCNQYIT